MKFDIRQNLHLDKVWLCFLCCLIFVATPMSVQAGTTAEDGMAIGALVEKLGGSDEADRLESMRCLAKYGGSTFPYLVGVMEYGSPVQRRGAILGMALLPIPALAADALFEGLADEDPAVRGLVARTLALSGSSVASQLGKALSSSDPIVRDAAAYSLHLMDVEAIPVLESLLASDNMGVKSRAAWLLGKLGQRGLSAAPALIRALDCKDERVMHVVAEAIDQIGPDPNVAYFHCLQIGVKAGAPGQRIGLSAIPTLVRLLSRPGTPLSSVAFRALASLGAVATPHLKQAVTSGSSSQRIASALLLADIDPAMIHTLPDDIRTALMGVRPQINQ